MTSKLKESVFKPMSKMERLRDIDEKLKIIDRKLLKKIDRANLWQELFSHYSDEHMELMQTCVDLDNDLDNILGYTDIVLKAFEREKANRAVDTMLLDE